MSKEKLIVILGIGAVLIVVFMLISWIRSDDVQPMFRNTLIAQNTVVELSDMAISDAASPDTRAVAASILSTTSSDRNQLAELYESRYESSVNTADGTAIKELGETRENFDHEYRQLVLKYLEHSNQRMATLQREFTNEEFNAIIKQARTNHQTHIEKLKQRTQN